MAAEFTTTRNSFLRSPDAEHSKVYDGKRLEWCVRRQSPSDLYPGWKSCRSWVRKCFCSSWNGEKPPDTSSRSVFDNVCLQELIRIKSAYRIKSVLDYGYTICFNWFNKFVIIMVGGEYVVLPRMHHAITTKPQSICPYIKPWRWTVADNKILLNTLLIL